MILKDLHKMIRVIVIALVLLQTGQLLFAATSVTDSLFTKGNEYYLQRQYAMAEQCYSRIVTLGFESADLYFNLANAYYKQDQFAQAILYYEKAMLLKPGNEDIRQNLALANARIIDKINVIPDFFLKRWMHSLRGMFSADQWAMVSLVLFISGLLAFLLFSFAHKYRIKNASFAAGVSLIILAAISIVLMFSRISNIRKHENAIIMSASVNARSSPDEQSTNVFVLHEGTKVMITDSVQSWKEIRLANGNTGWVQKEVLEEI